MTTYRDDNLTVGISKMHDLRWVRENPEEFDRGLTRRGLPPRAEEVLVLDKEWRALETRVQEARAQLNRLGREIGAAKARGEDIEPLVRQAAADKAIEAEGTGGLRDAIDDLLETLPNLPAPEVPDGPDETANRELRRVGEPTQFNFAPLAA